MIRYLCIQMIDPATEEVSFSVTGDLKSSSNKVAWCLQIQGWRLEEGVKGVQLGKVNTENTVTARASLLQARGISTLSHKREGKKVGHKLRKISA